jgi:Golgi phosphoprotein 3 GPP34
LTLGGAFRSRGRQIAPPPELSSLNWLLAGRLNVDNHKVVVADRTPVGSAVLDDVLAVLATAQSWVRELRKSARGKALDRLRERGTVRQEVSRRLGLFTTRRYPTLDSSVEVALLDRLAGVVLRGETPDERTVGLAAVLSAAGLYECAFPGVPARDVERRTAKLAHDNWAAPAVRRALEAMQYELVAVVGAATVGAAVAGTS